MSYFTDNARNALNDQIDSYWASAVSIRDNSIEEAKGNVQPGSVMREFKGVQGERAKADILNLQGQIAGKVNSICDDARDSIVGLMSDTVDPQTAATLQMMAARGNVTQAELDSVAKAHGNSYQVASMLSDIAGKNSLSYHNQFEADLSALERARKEALASTASIPGDYGELNENPDLAHQAISNAFESKSNIPDGRWGSGKATGIATSTNATSGQGKTFGQALSEIANL